MSATSSPATDDDAHSRPYIPLDERKASNVVPSTPSSNTEADSRVSHNVQKNKKEEEEEEVLFLTGFWLFALMSAVYLAMFLLGLDTGIVTTTIPTLTEYFHTDYDINWYNSAYMLAICVTQPLAGKLYTLFALKPIFAIFIVCFEIGSLICALAHTSSVFIAGRTVTGISGGGMMAGALIIVSTATPPKIRPLILSMGISATSIGTIVGPLFGGAITQNIGWRWNFWIFLPPGAVTGIIVMLVKIPNQVVKKPPLTVLPHIASKIDIIGFLLFTGSTVMFLLALTWGGAQYAWDSPTVIGLFCAAFVSIILFVFWAKRLGDEAFLRLNMLRMPVVVSGCTVFLTQGAGYITISYFLPLWFQTVKNASPTSSGVRFLPTVVASIIASLTSGALVRKLHYIPPWAIVGGALAAIGSGLMTTFTVHTSEGMLIGYQILSGAGQGLSLQMPIVAAQEILPRSDYGTGMSIISFCRYFGGSIATTVGQSILQTHLVTGVERYAPGLDPQTVIRAGARGINPLGGIPAASVPGVLLAYNYALALVFWMPTAMSIVATLAAFGLGWKRIGMGDKKPKQNPSDTQDVERKQSANERSNGIKAPVTDEEPSSERDEFNADLRNRT